MIESKQGDAMGDTDANPEPESEPAKRPWWKKKRWIIPIVVLLVGGAINAAVTDDPESEPAGSSQPATDSNEGDGGDGGDDIDVGESQDDEQPDGPPEVSGETISRTEAFIVDHDPVRDAYIEATDGEIRVSLIVGSAINEQTARDHLERAARFLASQAAMNHDRLSSPSGDSLGGLYEHHDLQVLASTQAGETVAHGAKVTGSRRITW